jgi:hypothetical protein
MSQAPAQTHRWLYGPGPDLLLGCGLLYVGICLVFVVDGGSIFREMPVAIPGAVLALVSAPHYGATLLRVYDRRADRRGYFAFSVVATAALLVVFGYALVDRWTGSIFATIYLTWAAWHYTGQNYGIAAMFLRRRGVELDPLSRRILHASFTLSFLLVFLGMHGQSAAAVDPRVEISLIPLAIPKAFNDIAIPLVLLAYFGTTIAWIAILSRRCQRISDLLPTLLISGIQSLWWTIPYSVLYFERGTGLIPLDWQWRNDFFVWVAAGHAAQYLWITSYYARASGKWDGQTRYYGRVLLAGSAVWALPALAFAPGRADFDWNFALLLAAAVNIHHFILDGAIWKLRQSKVARVLISDGRDQPVDRAQSSVLRKAVWAITSVGLLLTIDSFVEMYALFPSAVRSGHIEVAAQSLDRQAWLGKSTAYSRFMLGREFEVRGDFEAAAEQFEISFGMGVRIESLKRLIADYDRLGDAEGFVHSCERLIEIDGADGPSIPSVTPIKAGVVSTEFRMACLRVARTARAKPFAGQDATARQGRSVYQ